MTILMTALVVANLQLVVRIYDSVGVSPAELDRARASAGAILASVGIEPIWRPCHVSTCTGPVKPHEITIRVVRSSPQSEKDSLGFSVIDVPRHAGSLGTVYEDRVEDLAAQAGVDHGELLGRAMAHEIGHMLIGTPSHARFGLMRAVWRAVSCARDAARLDVLAEGGLGAAPPAHRANGGAGGAGVRGGVRTAAGVAAAWSGGAAVNGRLKPRYASALSARRSTLSSSWP
jgi:hypothetical protein